MSDDISTSLKRQIHNERYPFILHWEQLPMCKESMDFVAARVIAVCKKIIEDLENEV
jgi:hypothetical protein